MSFNLNNPELTPGDRGLTHDDCLDGPDGCSGEVEYRMPLSGTGKAFPRCDTHWEKRLETQEETNRKYGTGSSKGVMLEGYDFLDAGEYLDEDSY